MLTIGVREFKQQASKLLRRVWEQGDEILVTHHGKVIARIMPIKGVPENAQRAWEDLDQLAVEIGKYWQQSVTASEAVSEARR